LPDDRQLVLSLFYMSSMSIKEIAYFMGVSPNSIGIKLHRARKQLGERLEEMIEKHLIKEKLRSGFVFRVVDSIRDMPIPSLPKPSPTKWMPIPISIGIALLIGIIGYGISSGKDVSSDMPILRPAGAIFNASLLPNSDGQAVSDTVSDMEVLDMGSENIYQGDLASADAGTTTQTQPVTGTDSSGMVIRQIWDNAHDNMGQISPDGRYLSYVNWDEGNVAIQDFETGENRDVTDEGNWDEDEQFADVSRWSPDSKHIIYCWLKGPSENRETSLRIVGIDGSKPRVLYRGDRRSSTESEGITPRAWSRDGKHILAIHWKGKSKTGNTVIRDMVLVSVADGSIRVLKSLDGRRLGSFGHRMSLSPDGRYVAYDSPQSEDSENRDISLLATDGSHEIPLVEHPADDFAPFWSPDGNRIVFVSDRSGSMGIWVLEVIDGKPKGSPQLIKQNLNGMTPLGVTQDGSYYYCLPPGDGDVYMATLDPETGEVVIPPAKAIQSYEGFNSGPDFSPDGKYLVYVSRRPRGRILVIHSLETEEERELQTDISLSISYLSEPRWSPDGRSILILATVTDSASEKRNGFHQIDVETGAVTPVVLDDEVGSLFGPTPPVWSPDGSKIFFHRNGGGIRTYDLEAEREWKPEFQWPEGGKNGDAGLAISPDGLQLAFTVNFDNERVIYIAPSIGGERREITRLRKEETDWGRGLTWTPDGRHLLFLGKHEDGLCELRRISVDGGESQNLGLKVVLQTYSSIHPDGRRIAFTGVGTTPGSEVWTMENFLPTSAANK